VSERTDEPLKERGATRIVRLKVSRRAHDQGIGLSERHDDVVEGGVVARAPTRAGTVVAGRAGAREEVVETHARDLALRQLGDDARQRVCHRASSDR
jgi:hypothetical protein